MSVLRFIFGDRRRLLRLEDGQAQVIRENAQLRAKIARLEIALNARRADDIVGSRDALIPVPRPGTSAARLLVQNRRLRARAKAAEERATRAVEASLSEMIAVANVVDRYDTAMADEVRRRAERLSDRVESLALSTNEGSMDLYVEQVRDVWRSVQHLAVATDILTRISALDPRLMRGSSHSPSELAELMQLVIRALLHGGPDAAAMVIRDHGKVTEDMCTLGGEAIMYALALALGARWTEDVRSAWAVAIDDVTRSLGFQGSGTTVFSTEDSAEISSD